MSTPETVDRNLFVSMRQLRKRRFNTHPPTGSAPTGGTPATDNCGDNVGAYLGLKWAHVLAAIVIVGAHFSYGFWIVRGSSRPEALPFILRNITWFDERVVFPAYAVLFVAGLGMGFSTPSLFRAPWLNSAMALFVVLVLAHVASYRPTVLRMIRHLEAEGPASPGLQAAGLRERNVGITLVLLMIVIVFLMVVKPQLWGA